MKNKSTTRYLNFLKAEYKSDVSVARALEMDERNFRRNLKNMSWPAERLIRAKARQLMLVKLIIRLISCGDVTRKQVRQRWSEINKMP